jgi:hypothetical protein
MFLTNLSKIRMHKYPKGWVVEIQKKKWYGKKYWIPLISVAGIESEPWYFQNYDSALKEAVNLFKWDLMKGTQFLN